MRFNPTNNKLFYYLSDLHLENGFNRIFNINRYTKDRPYLILLGDIGYVNQQSYKDFLYGISGRFDKIFIVAGNHEYDGNKTLNEINLEIENICNGRSNLLFLQQKTFKICTKENIVLAGCTLWSKFPLSKYNYHLQDKRWLHKLIEHDTKNKYIFATHHCPTFKCIRPNKNSNYFASDQSNLLKKNNLLMWIHGHSHINNDFSVYNTFVSSNQYGSYDKPQYGFNEYK